jgi:Flp pilus assembly secretin CpaC
MTSDLSQRSRLRQVAAAAAIAAGLALTVGPVRAADDDDLIVKYDQSQLLRLKKPASEIIIGNPSIADVAIQSGNLLVITGKTFGMTNIIALDGDRNVIREWRVLVKRDEGKTVNLLRGTDRQTYNCSPQCNPSITIGDEAKYFEAIRNASQTKISISEGTGEKGPPGGQ